MTVLQYVNILTDIIPRLQKNSDRILFKLIVKINIHKNPNDTSIRFTFKYESKITKFAIRKFSFFGNEETQHRL